MAEMATGVRWGLVGAGDIAEKRVAPALRDAERSSLTAVARRRAELAESFASRFGVGRWFTNWEELVRDEEIDAVYVATPVDLHAEVTIAAAEAGKHVLCEKPMATTVADCDRMIAAAAANGVRLGVAYYRHLYPIVQRISALLREGTLGRPVMAQFRAFERFDPPADHPRAWLLDPAHSGGGPMFDFGCHRIELLLKLLGEPRSVSGVLTNAVFDRPVEDSGTVALGFEGGAIGTVAVSHAAEESQDTFDLFCESGSAHVPVLNGERLLVVRGGERLEEIHAPPSNLHEPLVAQFVAAILDGDDPAVGGEQGRGVNRVLAALQSTSADSLRTG